MNNAFGIKLVGKKKVTSHLTLCSGCKHLRLLSSYISTRVATFFGLPLFPLGKLRILDECPTCGHCGQVKARLYNKERKKSLALMMEGFTHASDDPENCRLALHTLMVYDEEAWFLDVEKTYGLRFGDHMEIQLLIARGLCRFGHYDPAIEHCRKASDLGGGKPAEELLEFCLAALVATKHSLDLEQWIVHEESARAAYIPMVSLATVMGLLIAMQGVSAFRSQRAWIVNGSLQKYNFVLDGEHHTLRPGSTQQIKLKLGEHVLEFGSKPTNRFTYSIPLIKQLIDKQLLVINPDAMALFAMTGTHGEEAGSRTIFSYGEQIRILPGMSQPLLGIRTLETREAKPDSLCLYRPKTHMAMVLLMQSFGLEDEASAYARSALADNPATGEFQELLPVALARVDDSDALAFLNTGLAAIPSLLPWHLYYQNYMMIHHPEHNLEHEYTLRGNNHSDDAGCFYLLGRVVQDRPTAYKFLEHSEKLGGMNGMGYHAIARDLFVRGSFDEALPHSEKALAIAPGNREFIQLNEQILLALRNYDALIEKTRSPDPGQPDPDLPRRTILYLTCAGYHREAEAEAVRFSQQHEEMLPELNAVRFYAVGNMDDYLECLAAVNDPHAKLEELLHRNQIADADALLAQSEEQDYREHLVLYCAAMDQGQQQIAERNLAQAIAEVGRKNVDQFRVAELLSGRSECTLDAIRALDIDASEKALLCVALGFSHPEMQKQLNELALVYNFEPAYPQLLLKRWIRSAANKQGA